MKKQRNRKPMVYIPSHVFFHAWQTYKSIHGPESGVSGLLELTGVTEKQGKAYNLRVSPLAAKKIHILAEGSPHALTLLKVLDARRGKW